ncbi:MAG: nitrous oxide-stimulated promoter family protein [Bacteroidales bacterium]
MGRIAEEQKTVEIMIRLYCRHKEQNKELCSDCRELLRYSIERLKKCLNGENKPICRKCANHCYNLAMRKRIKNVMQYSGPRMILYHPLITIKHIARYLFAN